MVASFVSLVDHLIRPPQQRRRDRQPERLGSLEVDDQLELGGQVGGLGALEVRVSQPGWTLGALGPCGGRRDGGAQKPEGKHYRRQLSPCPLGLAVQQAEGLGKQQPELLIVCRHGPCLPHPAQRRPAPIRARLPLAGLPRASADGADQLRGGYHSRRCGFWRDF